ncbi:MAG: CBS domain-containing protein [Rhodospirillaceae bacterium]|nr:CBS domain-containing protein [Rhodospirillaceae bacterium]
MSIGELLRIKGSEVLTVTPEHLIVEVARIMSDRRISLVVVCSEGGRVLGVISERDLVRAIAVNPAEIEGMAVEDLYTRDVFTCTTKDDARETMRRMHDGRFRHMPVVDHGSLKGLVSIGDILEFLKEQSELHSNTEAWEELNFL